MAEREYSRELAEAIDNYLIENDWKISFDEDTGVFRFGLSIDGKLQQIRYVIVVGQQSYTCYAISPIGADKDDARMMKEMAEFTCRANYNLKLGNFELDMRDGEIRFKVHVDSTGMVPNRDIIDNSISCPAAMFERYGAAITGLVFNDETAEKAVEKCEEDV